MLPSLILTILAALQPNALESGQRAFAAGDLARAESYFRQYLKINPRSAEALSNLAAVLARREQYEEAVGLYRKALDANPRLYPIHFNAAVSLINLRRYPAAIGELKAFLAAQPNEPRARQLLGLCLTETGENRAAIAELEAAYQANPNDQSILFSLSYAHARAGDEDRAAQLIGQAQSNPAQARLLEGLIEYRRERYPEARARFEEALAADPNLAPALAALGRLSIVANDDAAAAGFFERALKLNPTDAESTYQLGVMYERFGKTAPARQALRRAATLRAGYADPHYWLGRIALREKDYVAALKELELANRILPNHDAIHMLLGRTYQGLGREADAKREFEEVRKLKQAAIQRASDRLESDSLMKEQPEPQGKK